MDRQSADKQPRSTWSPVILGLHWGHGYLQRQAIPYRVPRSPDRFRIGGRLRAWSRLRFLFARQARFPFRAVCLFRRHAVVGRVAGVRAVDYAVASGLGVVVAVPDAAVPGRVQVSELAPVL